jgi:hypothetical protein
VTLVRVDGNGKALSYEPFAEGWLQGSRRGDARPMFSSRRVGRCWYRTMARARSTGFATAVSGLEKTSPKNEPSEPEKRAVAPKDLGATLPARNLEVRAGGRVKRNQYLYGR